ncbi:MAG: hypothetical protein IIB99_09615 [Planctomycetes bacterium]|nr:hypothetical protein [Planctomycetota bacterium]MCH8211616.1 hypothetical protein [Planctomycetota bacterium]MCH8260470.1 hypothetical protein [Planctomycetota bacterium]
MPLIVLDVLATADQRWMICWTHFNPIGIIFDDDRWATDLLRRLMNWGPCL